MDAPKPETALAVPPESSAITVATPTQGARRWDLSRRVVGSRWTNVGVGIATVIGLASPLPVLAPLAFAGGYIASNYVLHGRLRRFLNEMRPAYDLAERGHFGEAIDICSVAMRKRPWPISHLATLTLAYFLRRQGEFDQAIELNGLAARDDDGLLRQTIGIELAVCYALKGTTGAAMTWLPPIKRRHSVTAASYALVWARTGKTDEIHRLRVKQNRASRELVRHEARLLSVFKGYAVSQVRPDYLSIRPHLLEAGPAFASEFDYLGKSWPEMKAFVDTYVAPKDGEDAAARGDAL